MPEVSVILPVYNGEAYLREAIDSVLAQTFTDFELIIVDDGSTDGSADIIASYKDARIRYIRNEQNKGLIFSLNSAIDTAQGNFVARMDSDDIALAQRFEKQLSYLKAHETTVLATRVKLIDACGEPLPDWPEERENISFKQIKKFLPKDNCIAHPSVMGRTEVFKKYQYRYNQKYSEDYDLWLRLVADGFRIEKLPEPLLLYRILPTSVTRFKKVNLFFRLAKVKFRFLWQQATQGKFSGFIFTVFLYAIVDVLKAAGKEIKALFTK